MLRTVQHSVVSPQAGLINNTKLRGNGELGLKIIFEDCRKGIFRFVSRMNIEGEEELTELVAIYLRSFSIFNSATPCLQSYTEEEIRGALLDEENIKYLVYCEEILVGFALSATNVSKAPWINPGFYKRMFPELFDRGVIFYVKEITIEPKFQNTLIGRGEQGDVKLVSELFNFIARSVPEEGIIAFDCSERVNFWLCNAILSSTGCFDIANGPEGKPHLDRQVYYALKKTKDPVVLI